MIRYYISGHFTITYYHNSDLLCVFFFPIFNISPFFFSHMLYGWQSVTLSSTLVENTIFIIS